MKLRIWMLPALMAIIAGCGGTAKNPDIKAAVSKDTLVYQYKTFKQRADDCGNKPDSACTVISVKYPEFKDAPALDDTVKSRLVGLFNVGDKSNSDFAELSKNFLNAYKAELKVNHRKGMFYTLDNKAIVARQDSNLTTIQLDGYTFQGGAHGSSYTGFINWDTRTNKVLSLEDVLTANALPQLNKVAEKIFRKQENLSDTSSLARDYFFKDARFALNKNFMITPVGLRFLYNQYEIKPFAAGQTELVVPYTQIKTLLKAHTVIAQYLK